MLFNFFNNEKFKIFYNELKNEKYNIFVYLAKKNVIRQHKPLLLNYISNGLKQGNNFLTLIEQYKSTLSNTQEEKIIISLLDNIINNIGINTTNTSQVLKEVGLLNDKEFIIVSNYTNLYTGLDLILNLNKQKNNFNLAILLLFFPPFIVTILLFIFQPEIRDFAYNALSSINEYSTTKITIPVYLEDRYFFGYTILFIIFLYSSILYFINYIKEKHTYTFFRFFRLSEKEFIINTFSSIRSLRESGKSFTQSYKILSSTSKDIIIKKFYNEVYEQSQQGNKKALYDISKKFNLDKFNLSYFKIGILNNDLESSINTILEYNEIRYEKQIKFLIKVLPMIGEIIMTIIIVKPLIDIIMVTTVGAMKFTI